MAPQSIAESAGLGRPIRPARPALPKEAQGRQRWTAEFLVPFPNPVPAKWFRQWPGAFQSLSTLLNQSQRGKIPRRPAKLPPNRLAQRLQKRPPAPPKLFHLRV